MQKIYVLNIYDELIEPDNMTHKVALATVAGKRLELSIDKNDAEIISSALISNKSNAADELSLMLHRSSIASLGMKLDHVLLRETDGASYKAYAALTSPCSSIYMPIKAPEGIALALHECAPIYADGDAQKALNSEKRSSNSRMMAFS
jgi:hypothetical protein